MKSYLIAIFVILLTLSLTWAGELESGSEESPVRFQAMDIFIDSGVQALAAYQVEVRYEKDRVKIVGLEGGRTESYEAPPFYDPKGMENGRIIIAGFTLDDSPRGETRVARLHLRIQGETMPDLTIRVITAARPSGERISAQARIVWVHSHDR